MIVVVISASAIWAQVPLETGIFWESTENDMYSTGMIWRDANNDGYIDVYFSNGNDIVMAPNTIYINNYGQMPTSATWSSTNAEYSGHCAVGDIDDNGFADFLVANYLGSGGFSSPNVCNIYMNYDGLPGRTPEWFSTDSNFSFPCALGDADGDGDLDLAVGTGDGYTLTFTPDKIYFNVNGSMQTTPGWQSSTLTASIDITWGDVNNDGYLDLACCYDPDGAALFYNNAGNIETSPSWQADHHESANTLVFGDVNGDGWLDLVVAFNSQHGGSGKYRVYFNDGAGSLSSSAGWESETGGYGSALALYDYDNDGDDDLAAGRWFDRARVYENLSGVFTSGPVWRAQISTVPEELAWVDIDGDGVEIRSDTLAVGGGRGLFYLQRAPLYSLDSVIADGVLLGDDDFCYDLVSGWLSLGQAPATELVVWYQYSFKNDLTSAHWDTTNWAFANTNTPPVDFYADTSVGWAPLTVQFSDSSIGASSWLWDFGDGGSDVVKEPIHTFAGGGAHDVSLVNTLADGLHNRTQRKMVIALADTLRFPDLFVPSGDTLKIPIYLTNSQPVRQMMLPLSFAGELDLSYTGFDTDSCRTGSFEEIKVVSTDPASSRLALRLTANLDDFGPTLEPGDGRIVNLYFHRQGGMGANVLDTATIPSRVLGIDAGYVDYQPYVLAGTIEVGRCGDISGDGSMPDISDLTYLVSYFFAGGPRPPLIEAADVDGSGGVNISDITYMADYLFGGGPAPVCE